MPHFAGTEMTSYLWVFCPMEMDVSPLYAIPVELEKVTFTERSPSHVVHASWGNN